MNVALVISGLIALMLPIYLVAVTGNGAIDIPQPWLRRMWQWP